MGGGGKAFSVLCKNTVSPEGKVLGLFVSLDSFLFNLKGFLPNFLRLTASAALPYTLPEKENCQIAKPETIKGVKVKSNVSKGVSTLKYCLIKMRFHVYYLPLPS